MNSIHTPHKTDHGWVIDIPTELIQALGIAEGSQVVLEVRDHVFLLLLNLLLT